MKTTWVLDWLRNNEYHYEFELDCNHVWKNNTYAVVVHHEFGLRMMLPLKDFTESELKMEIKQILFQQRHSS